MDFDVALGRREFASAVAVYVSGCLDSPEESPANAEIEPGSTVELDGQASGWLGRSPSDIEGDRNPTLVLEEGARYVFRWVNADGAPHDLQIRGEDDEVVDELVSERVETRGEGASLEFTASTEMEEYVCSFHRSSQSGRLVVE
ncbi:MAG: PKD domain-containing protein [Halobacteriales archaeon]